MSAPGRKYISTACETCRKRRRRCDGQRPECGMCKNLGKACVLPLDDRRRKVQKGASQAHRRGMASGDLLRRHRVPTVSESLSDGQDDVVSHDISPIEDSSDAFSISGGSLTMESSGALRFVGPSSTFFRTNPLDAESVRRPPLDGNIAHSYLPFDIGIFTHNLLLNKAFIHLDWAEVIPQAGFRQGLSCSPLRRTCSFSPFIHLITLAIGCRYLDIREATEANLCQPNYDDRGDIFATQAAKMIDEECSDPNLGTIRGLLALSSYKVGRGDDRRAIAYHGLALSLAQDFRLHLRYHPESDELRPDDWKEIDEDRRHCFWTCSIVDVFWCSYLGRESSMPRRYFTQTLPTANLDSNASRLAFVWLAELSQLSSIALEDVYAQPGSFEARYKAMQRTNLLLNKWYSNLPDTLKIGPDDEPDIDFMPPFVLCLNTFYHALNIIIHRPFLVHIVTGMSTGVVSTKCAESAFEVVRFLRLYRTESANRLGPLSNQHSAFVAGSVLVMLACGMAGGSDVFDVSRAIDALQDLINFLRGFSIVWANSSQSADALVGLLSEIVTPSGHL